MTMRAPTDLSRGSARTLGVHTCKHMHTTHIHVHTRTVPIRLRQSLGPNRERRCGGVS